MGSCARRVHAGGRLPPFTKTVPDSFVRTCLAVENPSQVEPCGRVWRTAPRSGQQICIEQVEFDADGQAAEDPQNGQ
jgi:hypothetical protein